jgi:hypothetical protein
MTHFVLMVTIMVVGGLSVAMANLWFSLVFTTASVLSTINLLRNPPSSSGLTSE